MRRFALLLLALLALACPLFGQRTVPSRIHTGDDVRVYVYGGRDVSGAYTVQTDGAIYLPRVGRLVVAGLTAAEAQGRLLTELAKYLKEPTATVSILRQRGTLIYVVGGKQSVIPLTAESDLRQVFASAQVEGDPDLYQVSVFRSGAQIANLSASDLTSGKKGVFSGPLAPNDVVVVGRKPFIRVWVIGTVAKPERVQLNVGDDVYRAIAAAGEIVPQAVGDAGVQRSDYVITIRRGDEEIAVPAVPRPNERPVRLQDGDTVSVRPPTLVRVTFTGLARNPGEKRFREGTTLATAVGAQGGPALPTTASGTPEQAGSLKNVILFHNGIASFHDLSPSAQGPQAVATPVLGDGDVVYIPRNDRRLFVFGSVVRPGPLTMEDNRAYRLADAVAQSGGVAVGGSLTRVSLGRPGPDGRLLVKTYRLDKFIKDGDETSNPLLQPNDVVYIDTTRGIGFQSVVSGISAALLLNTLTKL